MVQANKSILILLLVLIAYVLLWSYFPQQFIASDPWSYSRIAYDISQGTFSENKFFSHIFGYRLGVTLPVALFYKVFGVNIITTNLWSLCAVVIIIITVWAALPTPRSKFFGIIICFSSVTLFQQATSLYPDIICTSFMALSSLFLFYRHKTLEPFGFYRYFPLLAIFFLFCAFTAKLTAYWILPLWIVTIVSDYREKKIELLKRFYQPVLLFGIFLLITYLVVCFYIWGNPFARLSTINAHGKTHLWSSDNISLMRLTLSPFIMFIIGYGKEILFAILALFLVPKELKFWVWYTLLTVLFFWFGSASFSGYQPLPLMPRIAIPSFPGLCILGGYFASCISVSPIIKPRLGNSLIAFIFTFLVVVFPFIKYLKQTLELEVLAEENAIRIVQEKVLKRPDRKFLLVCSDSRSPDSLSFYFNYQYPDNFTPTFVENLINIDISSYDDIFIFLNKQRSKDLNFHYKRKNFDQQIMSLKLPSLYAANDILLFKMNKAGVRDLIKANDVSRSP